MRTGTANLPLHPGKAPPWLFSRMVPLAEGIFRVMEDERGTAAILERLSDPFWFQAMSCVMGYDWHSSGTTTVACAAMKQALDGADIGLLACGGKGRTSRKAPSDIEAACERFGLGGDETHALVRSSRLSAKVDSAAVQDGHELYHHTFFVSDEAKWTVVQQGMCDASGTARRYHWLGDDVRDFACEPHSAILGERVEPEVLDMTSADSAEARRASLDLVNDGPTRLMHLVREAAPERQRTLDDFTSGGPRYVDVLSMPRSINWSALMDAYEFQPSGYQELLGMEGMGASTVRCLALASELIYGERPSWRDPVKYSFAVGGKDGVPYPVDRRAMEEAADVLRRGVESAGAGDRDRLRALERLRRFVPPDVC